MIKTNQVIAIFIRHFFLHMRAIDRILDIVFWPNIDVLLFGFTGVWMQQELANTQLNTAFIPLMGALLWQITMRSNVDLSLGLLEELWGNNFASLFITPLCFPEWVLGMMLLGLVRIVLTLVFCSLVVWLTYGFSILLLGWYLVPIFFSLLISGWMMGCFTSSLLVTWGRRIGIFAWVTSWVVAPFCGVFYPVDVLPHWMQYVSTVFPMTYVFTAIHEYVYTGIFSMALLYKSFALNGVYFVATILLFKYSFERAKIYGLTRLEQS